MQLTKHHALGNDFLITFVAEIPDDAPERARTLCDRRTGVGADGLIIGIDDGLLPIMRLFNRDGSAAEISGNGVRCLAQAIAMRRGVSTLELDIETVSGVRACTVEPTDDSAVAHTSVDMGAVTAGDRPDDDGFLEGIDGLTPRRWALAGVGNPHVVIEVDDPAGIDLERVGPAIEEHFADGVNAHFVRVADDTTIELRPWERGAGATLACGSGATASAQRAHDWGRVGETVTVRMPGGDARVDVMTAERPNAVLSGSTHFVAAVQVPHG